MQHLIKLTDSQQKHTVLFTLSESEVAQPALDVVFDIIGSENFDKLVADKIVAAEQVADLIALHKMIFDNDNEGRFIRHGTNFLANEKELDPESKFSDYFVMAFNNNLPYNKCDLVVSNEAFESTGQAGQSAESIVLPPIPVSAPAAGSPAGAAGGAGATPVATSEQQEEDPMHSYAMILLIHMLRIGHPLDVTKDWPEIDQELRECEKLGLLEIDVQAASYKLTAAGKALHKKYLEEAQELIRRYDIFCDVSVDSNGKATFDTGLGKDYRVPVYEFEGLDPFRARFLLGINDGEWDNLSNWQEALKDRKWYDQVFLPIEKAPSVEEVGEEKLRLIVDQARDVLVQQLQGARVD